MDAGQTPARIVLIEVPSRKEIRQKNLFSVADIAMYWHPDGSYLAVKVDRQKSKNTKVRAGVKRALLISQKRPVSWLMRHHAVYVAKRST